MENLKLLYTGKTKNVYALPNGNCLRLELRKKVPALGRKFLQF